MNLLLQDRPVLVCASSSGLGKATALEFAREGAKVMLSSRRESGLREAAAEIETATGYRVWHCVADLTQPAEISRLVDTTTSALGGIYTLVNNSGGPAAGRFDNFDDAAWQAGFELTLLCYVRTIRAALPHLRKNGGGRIVNFTSSSIKVPIDQLILSNAFRMGILGMAKTLSVELGPEQILVNVVGPGRIQTERIEQLDQARAARSGVAVTQVRHESQKAIPLGRYGTPDELARLAVFLGSPANTYLTGQSILVDGGMTRAY